MVEASSSSQVKSSGPAGAGAGASAGASGRKKEKVEVFTGRERDSKDYSMERKQAVVESEARLRYLEALVALRTLYRSFLRAQYWIEQPCPMLSSHPSLDEKKGGGEKAESKEQQLGKPGKPGKEGDDDDDDDVLDAEEELAFALDAVAEMALTSDQLSGQLKKLPIGFGAVFAPLDKQQKMKEEKEKQEIKGEEKEGSSKTNCFPSIESRILALGYELLEKLAERLEKELETLPFDSRKEAWSAVRQLITNEEIGRDSWNDSSEQRNILQGRKVVIRRVIKAEKAAEKLVERVRASSKGWRTMQNSDRASTINATASYMKGVWIRLNGGGKTGLDLVPLPEGLPRPAAISKKTKDAFAMGNASEIISIEVDKLDKELREASKLRETKLRKAGVLERARMDSDLKEAEENVNQLRSQLALKTLQLELRLVFEYLEKEALQIIDENNNFLPWRRGSSEELTLLVAEYALLDGKTTSLIGNPKDMFMDTELMSELATDVPDLRMRLGITDNEVVYMSLDTRIKNVIMTVEDSTNKVKNSFVFMGTGVKLLVTDLSASGKLFWRALLGGTLQPREVETLRRTASDILTFIPFIVILILPITPLGHVLVFSFIQQNFPALFPSQFTSARQKSMRRYEDLKKQLDDVLEQEGLKWREEQFSKAVQAVEALTSNVDDKEKPDEAQVIEMEIENNQLMDVDSESAQQTETETTTTK